MRRYHFKDLAHFSTITTCTLLALILVACGGGGGGGGSTSGGGGPSGSGITGRTSTTGGTTGGTTGATTGGTMGGTTGGTAALGFRLQLQGAVPFADRYQVNLSIDGTKYVNGFCGFSENTRCEPGTYDWNLPSVHLGSTLNWYYTWKGISDFRFAEGSAVFSQGFLVKARCAYLPSGPSNTPTCTRE